jgi:hypothetical protein
MKVQEPFYRCEHCGSLAVVRPGASPYEFEVECVCGRCYVLSHAHDEPPPEFQTEGRLPPKAGK